EPDEEHDDQPDDHRDDQSDGPRPRERRHEPERRRAKSSVN
ncbi:MAG: hypothetical protein QOF30_1485, partial [Acidimicrobiaceae bacterium]|nr:hypothetical protein [Acidimicrobiaceae bacterium]